VSSAAQLDRFRSCNTAASCALGSQAQDRCSAVRLESTRPHSGRRRRRLGARVRGARGSPRSARRKPKSAVTAFRANAYHITRPHPEAAGSIVAMRAAIARSGSDRERRGLRERARNRNACQRRRRSQGHERRVRRSARADFQRQRHDRPLHGRRKRARGHRVRDDDRERDLPADARLRNARSRVRRGGSSPM